MEFTGDLIEEGCYAYWVCEDTKLIAAAKTLNTDCDDTVFEYTALKGVLLSVKHGSGVSQKIYQSSSFFDRGAVSSKRQRVLANASYDRLYVFGDAMNPPNCFAIMMKSAMESRNLMTHCDERIAVGSLFYIAEPGWTDKTMGEGTKMLIITTKEVLMPLKFICSGVLLQQNIGAYELETPSQVGEQTYFVKHGATIKLTRF